MTVRDLEPRFQRASKRPPRDANLAVGASTAKLPVALACINSRNLATESLAATPRGVPRVLRVHQAEGPYKKLEDAMAQVRSDEVIEIADNAMHIPTRNFATAAANGVLSIDSVECLAIRAIDDSQAVIVLRDDVQKGPLPAFHPGAQPADHALYLLASGCRSLSLDGLHFRPVMTKNTRHSMVFHAGPNLRITNCTFLDTTTAPPAIHNAYNTNRFVHQLSPAQWNGFEDVSWFENDVFLYAAPAQQVPADPRGAETAINFDKFYVTKPFLAVRNCLFGSNMIAVTSICTQAESLLFKQCTVLGRFAFFAENRLRESALMSDNLVIVSDNAMLSTSPDLFARVQISGGGNAYCQTTGTLKTDERTQGPLRLLPGPMIKTLPTFLGNATPADALRPFRLKPSPPWSNMATDGGPVGARFEYMPDPPPFRGELIKRVK